MNIINSKKEEEKSRKINNEDLDIHAEGSVTCIPNEDKNKSIRKKLLNVMMEEFKHHDLINEEEIEAQIMIQHKNNIKLHNIKKTYKNQYQAYAVLLGSKLSELNNIKSPNLNKLTSIFQIEDRSYKNKELLLFIHKYNYELRICKHIFLNRSVDQIK